MSLDKRIYDKIGAVLLEYHKGNEEILIEILNKNNYQTHIDRITKKTGIIFAVKKDNLQII